MSNKHVIFSKLNLIHVTFKQLIMKYLNSPIAQIFINNYFYFVMFLNIFRPGCYVLSLMSHYRVNINRKHTDITFLKKTSTFVHVCNSSINLKIKLQYP